MSIYVVQESGDIVTAMKTPFGEFPMQKVLKNGKLVEEIFDYKRSHFRVRDNLAIFHGYSLDHNFGVLRQMCSLGDPKTEHVSSLIQSFSLTDEYGKDHYVEVGDGKYKSALFLYWLAEGKDSFTMDDEKRQLVWDYFGHDICTDAFKKPNTQHKTVRYLLNGWGSRVTIARPGDRKKETNVAFDDPNWVEHAHLFLGGTFGYISKSVILIRGTDNNIYLPRPYGQLTEEQRVAYDKYAEQYGPVQIIPEGMDIQEIFMDNNSSIKRLSDKVTTQAESIMK